LDVVTDPTGYAGPHPDLREQTCEMANMLAREMREHYTWPSREFVPADLTVYGQRTWDPTRSLNTVFDGGGFSALLVGAEAEGLCFGGLVTAIRRPDGDAWSVMSSSIGEWPEGRHIGGDTGGGGLRCIGAYAESSETLKGLQAVEIEYYDGLLHRGELGDDGCVIVYAPAETWDQANGEVTVRYLAVDGSILETYTMTFTGRRPPDSSG
jgi:hypothetical protein